ncbi:MAG TPA: hypothetical protein VFB12_15410 [Ktedonobacteraceae bacterium]|nr:hypothetical protein [Ktedonobacteraceae bacterium]
MPDYEARHYQQELDANHVLLLMNADDRPEEAFSIMRQNGAFDLNCRLRTASSDDSVATRSSNGAQETAHPDVPPTTVQPDVSPSTSQADTEPRISSPDGPPLPSKPDASSSRYNSDASVETPQNT